MRCSAIAQAFSGLSHVTMFSGARKIAGYSAPRGVDFVQLPALELGESGQLLPAPDTSELTIAEIERAQSKILVENYRRTKPNVVIIEFFPFSPHRFGTVLDALFETMRHDKQRPIVICSIRTYPHQPWDMDSRAGWINERLRSDFSCVLHHTDLNIFPLGSLGTYMNAALAGIPVEQTGFVRRLVPRSLEARPSNGLLLTVGGGGLPSAAQILKRWIKAARTGHPDLFPINVVCGPVMGAKDRQSVHIETGEDVTVHDWVGNMDELICASRGVVCLGGYNSLVEALSFNKPVLTFPIGRFGDQAYQVDGLHARGILLKGDILRSDSEITAQMNQLLTFVPKQTIDCRGAQRSVEIVSATLARTSD